MLDNLIFKSMIRLAVNLSTLIILTGCYYATRYNYDKDLDRNLSLDLRESKWIIWPFSLHDNIAISISRDIQVSKNKTEILARYPIKGYGVSLGSLSATQAIVKFTDGSCLEISLSSTSPEKIKFKHGFN